MIVAPSSRTGDRTRLTGLPRVPFRRFGVGTGLFFERKEKMSKRTFATMFLFAALALPARAEGENPYPELAAAKPEAPKAGSRTLFVVETDERSATESLNRVSGQIDPGFTYSEGDSYKSENHMGLSPFSAQQRHDDSTRY